VSISENDWLKVITFYMIGHSRSSRLGYHPAQMLTHLRSTTLRSLQTSASAKYLRSNSLNTCRVLSTSLRNMSSSKLAPADRLKGTDKNVWVTFTELARTTGAVNLGQGFPDYPPPAHVYEALAEVASPENFMFNQYTRGFGHPRLVNAIAKMYGRFHNRELDPMKEVLVTAGAYESLFCCFQGYVNPGDEVIIIEPFFDCYKPMTMNAGGVPKFIPLRPSKDCEVTSADWKLDPEELASLFNDKTKLIVLNTPNNPLGKVYTRDELAMIADLCQRHDVICIADEVSVNGTGLSM